MPITRILTGRTQEHLEVLAPGLLAHRDLLGDWHALRAEAQTAGFELAAVSAFRDFASQLRIWNAKALGKRPLLDDRGRPMDFGRLNSEQIIFAILRWSALPGASRHHWGTDIDVIDAKALPPGYQVQLIPSEVQPGGMFALLHDWLDQNMGRFGFFRPYARDLGGVSPERWHLSYAPLSEIYLQNFDLDLLTSVIRGEELELKASVLLHLPKIYRQYVTNISPRV